MAAGLAMDPALYYLNGTGVSQDRAAAAKCFEIACDPKDADGCVNVGKIYIDGIGVKNDAAKAKTFFTRACALGNQEACRLK